MTTIQIPSDLSVMVDQLGALGRKIEEVEEGQRERRWFAAAYVWARTEEVGRGKRSPDVGDLLTIPQFADLGIYGFSAQSTVYRYRRAWSQAINDGHAEPSVLGGIVTLPTIPFPAVEANDTIEDKLRQSAPADEKIRGVQKLVAADPEFEKRLDNLFVQKAAQDPALAMRVALARHEHRPPEPDISPPSFGIRDHAGLGSKILGAVEHFRPKIEAYADFLRGNSDPAHAVQVNHDLSRIDDAIALLREDQDTLRAANGQDTSSVLDRLASNWR